MITVVEPDRATARRLLRALYARGCSARVVHDFPVHRSHTLRVRTRDLRRRVGATIEVTRRLGALVRRRRAAAGYAG